MKCSFCVKIDMWYVIKSLVNLLLYIKKNILSFYFIFIIIFLI